MIDFPRPSASPLTEKAETLLALHESPEILILTNVWDAASASVVAQLPDTRALATASHAIAAAHGFEDGERIDLDTMIRSLQEIVSTTTLPVTADLEAGYGNSGETIRRAIQVGAVGANLEDQMRPLKESVRNVADAVAAAEGEGVPFVLNARTDALLAEELDLERAIPEAVERGRAYLDAGASCVFVPGLVDLPTAERLVAGIGLRKVSVLGMPGSPTPREYERLGIARISYGPWLQRAAMTWLQQSVLALHSEGELPAGTKSLP